MFIFGSIFGGGSSEPHGIPIAVMNQSSSKIARRIISTLDTMKAFQVVDSVKGSDGR